MPTTSKPKLAKKNAASEPIRPAEPEMRITDILPPNQNPDLTIP
jgi:hypothetical protein